MIAVGFCMTMVGYFMYLATSEKINGFFALMTIFGASILTMGITKWLWINA